MSRSVEIPASGNFPAILIVLSERQLTDPVCMDFLSLLLDSLGGKRSLTNLPASGYVALLRLSRFLAIRVPGWSIAHHICNRLQWLVFQVFRLSFRIFHKTKPVYAETESQTTI
jgi:hypothetical protein